MPKIIVEIDGTAKRPVLNDDGKFEQRSVPINVNWHFRPEGKFLRGKFELSRSIETNTRAASFNSPTIPGQKIEIDTDAKTAKIIEPLRDPENLPLVRRLVRKLASGVLRNAGSLSDLLAQDDPLQVGPREVVRELKDERDVVTWLYWLRRGVDAGCCRVVSGELPEKIEGKPKKRFDGYEPHVDPAHQLQLQQQAFNYAMMTPEQRKIYDKKIQELTSRT